jgi:invasion protein IalB
MRILYIGGLILLCALTAGCTETHVAPVAALQGGEQTQRLASYSPWQKFCGKGKAPNARPVCFTGKDGRSGEGKPMVAAALIEPEGRGKKLFRITLPSPMQMQYGTRLVIDNQPPLTAAFFTCIQNGCMSDYQATPELIARLKNGQMLYLKAINLSGDVVTYPVPLAEATENSFRIAHEGPPMDPRAFEEQQKRMQADLQQRP